MAEATPISATARPSLRRYATAPGRAPHWRRMPRIPGRDPAAGWPSSVPSTPDGVEDLQPAPEHRRKLVVSEPTLWRPTAQAALGHGTIGHPERGRRAFHRRVSR
jgi:hypothetical protein